MTIRHHQHQSPTRHKRLDSVSLVMLFIAVVSVAVGLVGIAVRGTAPWILIGPTLLGCWAIVRLNR
jgi:F0F1-type ATP synthase assembly protein I